MLFFVSDPKIYAFIGGGAALLLIIIIFICSLLSKKKKAEKVPEKKVLLKKEEPVVEKDSKKLPKETNEEETVEEELPEEESINVKVSKVEAKGKYELIDEGSSWRYCLKANNGEVLITSEPYANEKAVRLGIDTLKKNVESSRCDIIEDKHGLFSFRIITRQGRCLATSANYKTKARANSASESYKRFVNSEQIVVSDSSTNHTEIEKIEVECIEEHNGKYVIKQVDEGFIYQLIASNGRIIASSNIYKSSDTCLEAIEKFRVCVYEGSFFIYKDKNNRFQFKLYNKQNRLVLAGEVYDDRARVISVIESIKKLAKYASIAN